MKKNILVDLDVIIEYLKTGKGVLPSAYEKFTMHISTVTYAELLASKTFEDANLEKEVVDFVKKYFKVLTIDESTAKLVAKVIRDEEMTLAASTFVATARAHNMPVLTMDRKAYSDLEGIEFAEVA